MAPIHYNITIVTYFTATSEDAIYYALLQACIIITLVVLFVVIIFTSFDSYSLLVKVFLKSGVKRE